MKKLTVGLMVALMICVFSYTTADAGEPLSSVSAKVAAAPKVDGNADDAQWESAPELLVSYEDGPEDALVKTVHTDKEIFFLLQWEDDSGTQSIKPDMWVYDGTKWGVLKEVAFEGAEAAAPKDDMLSFQWNLTVPGFEKRGCLNICHAPEKEDKMYTEKAGEVTDLWLWKAGISNPVGYTDDYYMDNTNVLIKDQADRVKRVNAAHKGDEAAGYIRNEAGGQPKWMPKGGANKDPFLIKGNEAPLGGAFKKGDTIPGWVLEKPKGSRGDISTAATFDAEGGVWTVEMSRALVTGDKAHDVQFNDLKKTYYYGIANWDNITLDKHVKVKDVIGLTFK